MPQFHHYMSTEQCIPVPSGQPNPIPDYSFKIAGNKSFEMFDKYWDKDVLCFMGMCEARFNRYMSFYNEICKIFGKKFEFFEPVDYSDNGVETYVKYRITGPNGNNHRN